MGLVTDIFNQNAWGVIEFQEQVVERVDFKPQLLGSLNLFSPIYSRSRTIGIASKDRSLALIPTSQNGEPPVELIPQGAKVRKFDAVRLAKASTIYAIELAGVAALPFEQQVKDISDEVAERSGAITDDMELTWEYHRFGAIQGKVLDADGTSVLFNWFDEWGITEPTEIDFALDDANTDVRKKFRDLKRQMQVAGKGLWGPNTQVAGLVSDLFFDSVVNHPQIKETKLGTEKAAMLENIDGYSSYEVENVTLINYRGTDDGSTIALGAGKARFFPVNARGAFQVGWAPASEFKAYYNQKGRELYGIIEPDPSQKGEWDRVEYYSYPLFICTRPEMLIPGKAY